MNLRRPSASSVNLSNGESATLQKLQTAFERSKRSFPSAMTLRIRIPPSSSDFAESRVDSKGDFLAEYVTGKIWCENADGTTDPLIQTGVSINVNESGNNRDLFLAPIPAETLLTPGYGETIYEKWNLRDYVFNKNATVRLSAFNSHPTKFQVVELTFIGFQFIGSMA